MLATPVLANPSLSMNIAQTVITAGLLNPDTASEVSSTPVNANAANTRSAVTSILTFSVTKRTSEMTRIERTMAISAVMWEGDGTED